MRLVRFLAFRWTSDGDLQALHGGGVYASSLECRAYAAKDGVSLGDAVCPSGGPRCPNRAQGLASPFDGHPGACVLSQREFAPQLSEFVDVPGIGEGAGRPVAASAVLTEGILAGQDPPRFGAELVPADNAAAGAGVRNSQAGAVTGPHACRRNRHGVEIEPQAQSVNASVA